MERGDLEVRVPQIAEQIGRLELAVRRMVGGVIFAALLVGGVQLYLSGQMGLGGLFFMGAALTLLWIVLVGRTR
jgi:hypothetical protein